MSVDATVQRFLVRAGILSRYHQFTWFGQCSLQGPILWCPDQTTLKVIAGAYLADLQAVRADLELRVAPHHVLPTQKVMGKTVYKGQQAQPEARDLWDS
jgi:hypothetical protein